MVTEHRNKKAEKNVFFFFFLDFCMFFKTFQDVEKIFTFAMILFFWMTFKKRFSVFSRNLDWLIVCVCLRFLFSGLCVRLKKPATTESKQTNFFSFIRKSVGGYFGSGLPLVGVRKSVGKNLDGVFPAAGYPLFIRSPPEFSHYPCVCAFPCSKFFLFVYMAPAWLLRLPLYYFSFFLFFSFFSLFLFFFLALSSLSQPYLFYCRPALLLFSKRFLIS